MDFVEEKPFEGNPKDYTKGANLFFLPLFSAQSFQFLKTHVNSIAREGLVQSLHIFRSCNVQAIHLYDFADAVICF